MSEVIACLECGAVHPEAMRLVEENEGLKHLVASQAGQIKRLSGQQAKAPEADPLYPIAMEVLEAWKEKHSPGTRSLTGGGRPEAVLARLHEGYTKEQLIVSMLGYTSKPFLRYGRRSATGKEADREIDAARLFASADMVDRGLRLAAEAGQEMVAVDLAKLTPVGRLHRQLGLGL